MDGVRNLHAVIEVAVFGKGYRIIVIEVGVKLSNRYIPTSGNKYKVTGRQ